jgi:hypothetical protein
MTSFVVPYTITMSKRSLVDTPLEDGSHAANKKSKPSEIDIPKLLKLKDEEVFSLPQSDLADAVIRLRQCVRRRTGDQQGAPEGYRRRCCGRTSCCP